MPNELKGLWPGLWMVATPIGNLSDITERAKTALSQADLILCEDTRRTKELLNALGISNKLERFDSFEERKKTSHVVELLLEGKNIAFVSDAGTPGVSDPGSHLVREARANGIRVSPVPGVSALTALLSVCGHEENPFVFIGFFPRKAKDAQEFLAGMRAGAAMGAPSTAIAFESPQRIADALEVIEKECRDCEITLAKELTKLHEWIVQGPVPSVRVQLTEHLKEAGERGEWCFALRFPKLQTSEENLRKSEWVKSLELLCEAKVPVREASRLISQHFGVSKNEVYELALSLTKKNE